MNVKVKLGGRQGVDGPPGPTHAAIQFGHPNLSAGMVDHQLNWGGVAALDGLLSFVPPKAGSVIWVSASLSELAVGSSVILDVFKSGVELVEAATIADGADAGFATFAAGAYRFAAGNRLDLRVTTGAAWTSITADIGASMGLLFDS